MGKYKNRWTDTHIINGSVSIHKIIHTAVHYKNTFIHLQRNIVLAFSGLLDVKIKSLKIIIII